MRWMLLVLALAACAARTNPLTARASFDLNCPDNQLRWQRLKPDGIVWGASGCGQRATYVYNEFTDQWIMNARGETSAAPLAPQSGPPGAATQQGVSK